MRGELPTPSVVGRLPRASSAGGAMPADGPIPALLIRLHSQVMPPGPSTGRRGTGGLPTLRLPVDQTADHLQHRGVDGVRTAKPRREDRPVFKPADRVLDAHA